MPATLTKTDRPAPAAAEAQNGATSMSSQINVLDTDVLGSIAPALVVLMTILAMLGVIANVAMA